MSTGTDTTAAKPTPATEKGPVKRGWLSRDKMRLGLILTLIASAMGGGFWWMMRPVAKPPAEQVRQALKLLDQGKYVAAREMAKRLEEKKYRHPGFTGALDYIQGMAAFGMIEASGEPLDRSQYALVIPYLQQAERLSLDAERRPAWSYALGKSLYMVHDSAPSRPLLEESMRTYPEGVVDASEMLIDLYLDPGVRSAELLNRAFQLNEQLVQNTEPPQTKAEQIKRQIAWLQRSEIFLAMKKFDDAKLAMAHLDQLSTEWDGQNQNNRAADAFTNSPTFQMLRARIWIQQAHDSPSPEECYTQAIKILQPFVERKGASRNNYAEPFYLMGLANELLSELETLTPERKDKPKNDAKAYFDQTAERFAGTPEAVAANLHLGRLWRLSGFQEKALQTYGKALRSIRHPENFRNRWVSLDQFRRSILEAWNEWLDQRQFSYAIALSELMTPVFPREEAYEFSARAHQRWAEEMEEELARKNFTDRVKDTEDLRRRWRLSAEAYMRLADVRISSSKYPEALWNAAEQFRRGHDFEQALEMINRFFATEPDRMLAAALVQRSRIELDLDQITEALTDLQQVVKKHPTDPAIFTAMYLIGVCYFEQNDLEKAEAVWRGILQSDQLLPSAVEWRDAQLSLGRLMYERGELDRRKVLVQSTALAPEVANETFIRASNHWQESARLLGRYLDRNSTGSGVREARYYLAKSLQREAEWLDRQRNTADTANARIQFEKQQDNTLERSLRQFEMLRNDLLEGDGKGRIDELEQRLLKNCYFEIPHNLFQLRRYNDSIAAYNTAVSRYPNDVQTLVAFLQMAQCYESMDKPMHAEARSMLQQAKVILTHKQIPDSAFQSPSTNFSRAEWQAWLERAQLVK